MINRCNFVHNSNNRTVKTIIGDTLYYQNENWKKTRIDKHYKVEFTQ